MSGMLDKAILRALHLANFEKITAYIIEICGLIVEDYERKHLKLPNDENTIRSIMLEEYMKPEKDSHGMSGFRFDLEVPENYIGNGQHAGRVDIRILSKSDFEKEDAYYIIECKRIDGSPGLNRKYVNEGIARFVTGKYSSYYGRSIMLGFVVKEIDISLNAQKIEMIQNSAPDQRMHGCLEPMGSTGVAECYRCAYKATAGEVELRHVFSDCSSVIQRAL